MPDGYQDYYGGPNQRAKFLNEAYGQQLAYQQDNSQKRILNQMARQIEMLTKAHNTRKSEGLDMSYKAVKDDYKNKNMGPITTYAIDSFPNGVSTQQEL